MFDCNFRIEKPLILYQGQQARPHFIYLNLPVFNLRLLT